MQLALPYWVALRHFFTQQIKNYPRLTTFLGRLLLLLLLFKTLDWAMPLQLHVGYSQTITDRKGTVLHAFLTPDDKWRLYTELPEISQQLASVIVFKEDKFFYYHFGVNPISMVKALYYNTIKGRRTSGASTITMQVARMLQPKERSYANKLIEIFRAWQLEWHYSKAEILQLYLNLVPYGGNIEGIKAASVLFFGKLPEQLSPAQVTTLAIIPNRPSSLALGKNNEQTAIARNVWLKRFAQEGIFSSAELDDALTEPLTASRQAAPNVAMHLSNRLKRLYKNQPIIKSCVDYHKQRQIEQLVANYIERQYTRRIRNAAVLVINNRTHQVEAYVGSADFFKPDDGGQVDGVRATRSPGSTLKPLLTALAFDRGLLTPQMRVADVPISFAGYSPVNYDQTYSGSVSYEYALSHSLNVPFVSLLERYGVADFVNALADAGCKQIREQRQVLGLSTILGGCGTSLAELTAMYSGFANGGRLYSPQLVAADSTLLGSYTQICSAAAAYVVTDILDELTRPDMPQSMEASSMHLPQIAWKTGTSYGRKDAWSIGYNANYTVGVWTGNFSGEGVQELTGNNIATPLLFEVFNAIDYNSPAHWSAPPKTLQRRWVCSETGLLPNTFCINKRMDSYLPGVSTAEVCQHLITVAVSKDESMSYCTACIPNTGYHEATYDNLLPEIMSYYEQQHIPYRKIPAHNPQCERFFANGTPPRIIHPTDGLKYVLDVADNDQIMLGCNTAPDVHTVFWYANDVLIGESTPNKRLFFTPIVGKNSIVCVDDKGRQHRIYIEVQRL